MVNLALYEFTKEIKKGSQGSSKSPTNSVGERGTKVKSRNITDDILKGVLNTKKKFALLFLYNPLRDKEAMEIINSLGGYIHNLTASNISFITYFDDSMIENWDNIIDKNEITGSVEKNEYFLSLISNLMEECNVKNRSLVIYECTGNRDSFAFDVSSLKANDFRSLVEQVINIIYKNFNHDLKTIVWELQGPSKKTKKDEFKLADFLDKVKRSNKVMNHMNREDIAFVLGLSVRTVYNKIYNVNGNSFTREECIKLITAFNPKIVLLDEMLNACNLRPLGFNGQDKVIRDVYTKGFSSHKYEDRIYELNRYLFKEGYETV